MVGKAFIFKFGDIEVREREFTLVKSGVMLPVEPKAFRVLMALLRNPGKLITKEELLDAVWGETAVSENSLARSIALLRKLLGDEARDPRYIETVATVGYRWVCKVEVSEDNSAELEASGETPESKPSSTGGSGKKAAGPGHGSRSLYKWLLSGAAAIGGSLAILIWYMHRPLPPPRIIAYTRITNDGRDKRLAGTDGSRLYFTQMQPKALAQVGVAGGGVAQISAKVPGIFFLLDVAPDGSSLLVQSLLGGGRQSDSVYSVGSLEGTVRRLGAAKSAAFSPDGKSISYTNEEGALWLVGSDGTGGRQLASVGVGAANLHWSPDGRMIGFDRDGALWTISSDGSNLHQKIPHWKSGSGECCGRWTADGNFYLFLTSPVFFGRSQIWALDERRGLFRNPPTEPVQLTLGPIDWSWPVTGKDGKTVFATGRTARGELCRFDATTKQLLPYLGGISAQDVSFSRDGRFVAYVTYPDGVLWKADRDGGNPVQLSNPPLYAMNPRWSPDATQIAFSDARDVGPPGAHKIYEVSSEGGNPKMLLPEDPSPEEDPNWSADGSKVVFFAFSDLQPPKRELRILDLHDKRVTVLPGSAGLWSPRWSPNGKYIAAMSSDFPGLKVLDISTNRWSLLPVDETMEYPAWSSDSQSIYFMRLINGDRGVYRIHIAGGKIERVADLKDWHITGYFSFWMALDPTDTPLILRDTGTDDIFALTLDQQ